MSDIQVPFAIVSSLISGVAAFAFAWGLLRGRLSALEKEFDDYKVGVAKRFDRLESTSDEHTRTIHQQAVDAATTARRLSDISELKDTMVRADVFNARQNAQDDALAELRISLERKVSISSMPATQVPGPPPMRARAPSRPGGAGR